jgi:hypothetical protein
LQRVWTSESLFCNSGGVLGETRLFLAESGLSLLVGDKTLVRSDMPSDCQPKLSRLTRRFSALPEFLTRHLPKQGLLGGGMKTFRTVSSLRDRGNHIDDGTK